MSNKRAPDRSLEEWMELVTECSQSGLLRILWENPAIWTTSCLWDVVQIAIEPESSPAGLIPDNGSRPMHLDNSHTIEIEADGLLIRMSNEIKPVLLKMLMDTLTGSL